MRLGLMVGYSGSQISLPMEMIKEADRLGYYAVWTAEAYGSDAVTPLAWIGAQTERIKLGTAILQMPARTPANTAMTAITLDQLSGGRMLLGLGLSGPQVVEGWHGVAYGKPLGKTREYVSIVRAIFARETPLFLEQGAGIVGGCCGTTPMHIRAMRAALDEHLAAKSSAPAAVIMVAEEAPLATKADYGVTGDAAPTDILRKLRAGKFVISVEVDPPRSFTAEKQIEGARHALKMGADAVNVADSPMARVRMSALALCVQIQQQVGIESIVHFTTRDRSLMGLQADLIGAHALGVRNILALTGDPPSLGDTRQSTAVYDVDSIGLVRIINRFNDGVDVAGQEMGQKGGFTIAVACDPTRADLVQEVDRFHQKVSGGAHFTMTQPIFDPQLWVNFVTLYEQRHGQFPVPVLIGVLPLQGHKHATFLHNEVPGITLSADALERMRRAGANGRQEGVRMAQELLLELKGLPYVQGVYLMPSFGRYETACQVLEVIPAQERFGG